MYGFRLIPPLERSGSRFHQHTMPAFNRASAGVASSMVVLMAFLVGFKEDPRIVDATLSAIAALSAALVPFLFTLILDAFAGQRDSMSDRWERNYRQTMAAFILLIIGWWAFSLVRFYLEIEPILRAPPS